MKVILTDQDVTLFDGPLFPAQKNAARGSRAPQFRLGGAGVPEPAPTAPAQFSTNQWSVSTGFVEREIVLNVSALPDDGRSPITALEYNAGAGWVALEGTGTGPRILKMASAGTNYTFILRARNEIGEGTASGHKTAASGAPENPQPAAPSAFYGTGPGQVPLHCPISGAVMSGANIQRIPNLGGAGSAFDMIAGTASITVTNGAADMTPDEYFRFGTVSAAAPDLMGTTVFMRADLRSTAVDQFFFGQGSPQTDIYLKAGGAQMVFNRRSEVTNLFETVMIDLSPAVSPRERTLELSVDPAGPITVTIAGELRGTGTHPGWPTLRAWNFAAGRNPANANGLNALIKDVVSLRHGGSHDANRPAIRAWLDEEYAVADPASLLLLTDPAENKLFTVQDRTDTALSLSRGDNTRSHFTFNAPFPIGSRIRFNVEASDQLWCRLADDALLSGGVTDIFVAQSGMFSVDYVTQVSKLWFGFLVASFVSASTVSITNFRVDAP